MRGRKVKWKERERYKAGELKDDKRKEEKERFLCTLMRKVC